MNTVALIGAGLYLPDAPSLAAWTSGSATPAAPTGAIIEPRSRRRASPITKALADAFAEALAASGADPALVATVFGSAVGEVSTMVGLLDTMWCQGELSPMAFATSVHNAAAGVVSISTANRAYTTSIGADFDTPAAALIEALGLVATSGGVAIVTCGDEAVPERLVDPADGWELAAASVAIAAVDAAPMAPRLTIRPRRDSDELAASLCDSAAIGRNPCAGLVDLALATSKQAPLVVALDRGRGTGWVAELSAPGSK
ncbi:MAG: beta-ketoacyl synthase chain length factor [Myxococcales bacterium]|nr:beta-ketoacyl synthase chain length factor [Myxococcales bacterium]MCB9520183.1 beta-ketoacyl synthase chain length factor [Myxococcales bacterium]MCB9531195.1 beta-ketoacyl synthase chain length factor [Myxococcales bacterium]